MVVILEYGYKHCNMIILYIRCFMHYHNSKEYNTKR